MAEAVEMDISFRATKISQPTKVNCDIGCGNLPLVYPGGFEPLAFGVGVLRSIQLSYEYTFSYCFLIIHCYLHKIKKGCMLSLKKDDELPELGYSI